MKDCFGIGLGAFIEENVEHLNKREDCHACEDFDRCVKAMTIKQLVGIKHEIIKGVRGIRNSLGGSHKEHPFG